jgi:hypothetical protein
LAKYYDRLWNVDAFQKIEATRRWLTQNIVPSWVVFRSCVESLIISYNETEEGKAAPAVIVPSGDDHTIVISSDRGIAKDMFHYMTVAIQVTLNEGDYVIVATRENWLTRYGQRISRQNQKVYKFTLKEDSEDGTPRWTSSDFGSCSSMEAAESLLLKSLTT